MASPRVVKLSVQIPGVAVSKAAAPRGDTRGMAADATAGLSFFLRPRHLRQKVFIAVDGIVGIGRVG